MKKGEEKKPAKKARLIVLILVLAVVAFVGLAVWSQGPNIPDPPNTLTLNQGTQMHYGEIFIGLGSVNKDSAWIMINKDGAGKSVSKQVRAGDKVDIYGYTISVSSVKETFNPSIMPGSSHGYVKFVINKK